MKINKQKTKTSCSISHCITALLLALLLAASPLITSLASEGGGHDPSERPGGGHRIGYYYDDEDDGARKIRTTLTYYNGDGEKISLRYCTLKFYGDGYLISRPYYFHASDMGGNYELGIIVVSDKPMYFNKYCNYFLVDGTFINTTVDTNTSFYSRVGENGTYYFYNISLGLSSFKIDFTGFSSVYRFSTFAAYDTWRSSVLSEIDLSGDDYETDDPDPDNPDDPDPDNPDNPDNPDDPDPDNPDDPDPDNPDNPDDPDPDKPDFDLDWSNIFTLIYSILKALIDFIVFCLNMFFEFATLLLGQIGQFSSLIGAVFTFLPEEFITMLLTGVTVIVIVGIVRR